MPLDEEGAKWSCEPCIRGHRSSKCQHFDRLMMKVPKAGRPLAKCPHPKGTCSCQKTYAVMVRIPKGSGCLCRPLYNVPLDANGEPQSTTSPMAPIASPTPGKIQKSGRRQSSLQAAPENIAKAFDAMPGPVNLKFENDATNQPFNFESQPNLDGAHTSTNHDISDHASSDATQIANSAPQPTQQGSACCSQKSQTPAPAPNGSCCGKPAASSADDFALSGLPEHNNVQHSSWDNMSYEQFSAPQMSSWQPSVSSPHGQFMEFGMNEAQPQPTSYMNGHGQNMSTPQSMMYPDQVSGLGISQTAFPMQPQNASNRTVGGESCTECNCGDDCQCLGCSVHPFNNTTRQHVQEMGVIMTFDGGDQTPDGVASAYQSSPFPGGTTPLSLSFMQQTPSMDPSAQQNYAFEPYSDPNSNLSTGYSSPLSANHPFNQQLMHPSEYYTLEYPVGLPGACSDITGSCQCGSDCSCVGCLTHSGHNGVPLESPIPDRSVAGTSEQHPSCHSAPASPSQHHTSRIPVLDSNISVPRLSPRTLETSMI